MARPNQVPESSMEEILASIRKIISEDEAKPAGLRPTIAAQPEPRPASNVSRLFAEEPVQHLAEEGEEKETIGDTSPEDAPSETSHAAAGDSTLSFPRYREDRPEPASERTLTIESAAAVEAALSMPDRQRVGPSLQQPSLLSPRADAAVAAAFNHLAGTILATNSRTIEQMAEEMMRPMLKAWLDDNLPPLVERLVREEIERVSRRR